MRDLRADLERKLGEKERKAWEALARYKFWMFGYHAAGWVMLNQLAPARRRNAFWALVAIARRRVA